ncbi:MAG: hypothetical protein AAAFM81_09295, partial [Pseudomonadota bacterium]
IIPQPANAVAIIAATSGKNLVRFIVAPLIGMVSDQVRLNFDRPIRTDAINATKMKNCWNKRLISRINIDISVEKAHRARMNPRKRVV